MLTVTRIIGGIKIMKISWLDKLKLYIHGYKIACSKKFQVIWERKTGEPISYSLPIADKPPLIDLASLNIADYCNQKSKNDIKECKDKWSLGYSSDIESD